VLHHATYLATRKVVDRRDYARSHADQARPRDCEQKSYEQPVEGILHFHARPFLRHIRASRSRLRSGTENTAVLALFRHRTKSQTNTFFARRSSRGGRCDRVRKRSKDKMASGVGHGRRTELSIQVRQEIGAAQVLSFPARPRFQAIDISLRP